MKAGSFTALNCDARTNETEPGQGSAEAAKAPREAAGNRYRRLVEQIRKILGQHYASKYRVR